MAVAQAPAEIHKAANEYGRDRHARRVRAGNACRILEINSVAIRSIGIDYVPFNCRMIS